MPCPIPCAPKIYAEMATSECPLNCSNFRQVDNRTLPTATLSQHFKILREAGLIRSERKGVEMDNTTRCAELKEHFGDMLTAILTIGLFLKLDQGILPRKNRQRPPG
jgi:DNA-binding transcriptional ArsR family regulator